MSSESTLPVWALPSYWDGHDILDEQAALAVEPAVGGEISRPQYLLCTVALARALRQIYSGNSTEVRYSAGTQFDPSTSQAPDGSVVVVDAECVTHELDGIPDSFTKGVELSLPLSRPYTDYWRNHQPADTGNQPSDFGWDIKCHEESQTVYRRTLLWGVLYTLNASQRMMLPHVFSDTRSLSDGSISVISFTKFHESGGETEYLPLDVGPANHQGRQEDAGTRFDLIERIRSLELVHLAPSDREDHTQQATPLRRRWIAFRPIPGLQS